MVSVGPVIVTILSGQLPSEILIRAPLLKRMNEIERKPINAMTNSLYYFIVLKKSVQLLKLEIYLTCAF